MYNLDDSLYWLMSKYFKDLDKCAFSCQHNLMGHMVKRLNSWLHPMIEYIYTLSSILFIHISSKSFLEPILHLHIYNNFMKLSAELLGLISQFSSLFYSKFQGLYLFLPFIFLIQITPPFIDCTENEFQCSLWKLQITVSYLCTFYSL